MASVAAGAEIAMQSGWRWRVHQSGLDLVDNLARLDDGAILATLERGAGRGKLVKISGGQVEILLEGLQRPDGLVAAGKTVFLTEEVARGRILSFNLRTGKQRTLARLRYPEGIAVLPGGDLLLTEDINDGRLLRLTRKGALSVLQKDLQRPEGIQVGADGGVYIAETGTGRILKYHKGKTTVVLQGLRYPDQLAIAGDGSLWIAEDARPGRVLRYHHGVLEVIASGLLAPQGMTSDARGGMYVAEQHRHRILRFYRQQ